MLSITKDPNAVLDYTWNWFRWLGGDTITVITVTAATGLTVASSYNGGTYVTAWLSGGTAGTTYTVVNHITTAAGRQDDRTILVTVAEK